VWVQNLLPQLYFPCNNTETSETLLSSCRRYHTHLRTDQQQYRENSREVILPHHEHNRATLVDYSVKEYQIINTPIFYAKSLTLPALFFFCCNLDEANIKIRIIKTIYRLTWFLNLRVYTGFKIRTHARLP